MLARLLTSAVRAFSVEMAPLSAQPRKTLVAVCQMTSTEDREKNLTVCKQLVRDAAERKAKMVFLPEALDVIGNNKEETISLASAESGPDGNFIDALRESARTNNVWISVGGFHEKVNDLSKCRIVHLLLNDRGETVGRYEKLHLFDVDIPGRVRVNEHDFAVAGNHLVPPIDTPAGRLGMCVCYDMRFPELSGFLRASGAQLLSYPSAFTVPTGMAHWEVLLRARAVENQCYVLAAAQGGAHNAKRSTYGNAMIIDPWGHVLARCAGDHTPDIAVAEIDLDRLNAVRQQIPCFRHKRSDLYHIATTASSDSQRTAFEFGDHSIPREHVFVETSLSFAFVNRKPVVDGHVLVCPIRRSAVKLTDLTADETSDLFQTAARVERMLLNAHDTDSCTLSIQDGVHCGRSIDHLHVHMLPRRKGDFAKDDQIHVELESHDKNVPESQFRLFDDMAKEAQSYRDMLR